MRAFLIGLLILCSIAGALPIRPATVAAIESREPEVAIDFPAGVACSLRVASDAALTSAEVLFAKANDETLNLVSAEVDGGASIQVAAFADLRAQYAPP